jgi:exosortase
VSRLSISYGRFALPVALLLLAFAHRGLIIGGESASGVPAADRWFFAPDEKSPLLVIPLSAWIIWRRRDRLMALGGSPSVPLAGVLLALALVLFVWADWVRAADLLLYCLCLEILGFGALLKGWQGCRCLLLPGLVLLIAAPIPAPLYNEVVWQLQMWTTDGASFLLGLAGFDPQHADALIRVDDRAFVVVEACSGLRGIEILLVAAFAIREVFAYAGRRVWLVPLLAPFLAAGLNAVRVASIAFTDHPGVRVAIAEGHLIQGVAVILTGTITLYVIGWLLARNRPHEPPPNDPQQTRDHRRVPDGPWLRAATYWTVGLAAVTLLPTGSWGSREPAPVEPAAPAKISMHQAGWTGEDMAVDMLLVGNLPLRPILSRRYEMRARRSPPTVVELLIAYEDTSTRGKSPFSSKMLLPGAEWSLESRRLARIWPLDRQADLARTSSGSARALVYRWHEGEEPLWLMTGRSMLALDRSNASRRKRRVVIRLATPITRSGPVAEDRAKQALDGFIADFQDQLRDL